MQLSDTQNFRKLIELALAEDLEPCGDITTKAIIDKDFSAELSIQSRNQGGIMSGSEFMNLIFEIIDPTVKIHFHVSDGEIFGLKSPIATLKGSAQSLLIGERLFLNLLQRAISIATYTNQFVELAKGSKARILDTRKTTPGLRALERKAVRDGGGFNHRFNLSTGILIKDNHIALAGSLEKAVEMSRENASHLNKIEIEVDSLEQVAKALEMNIDLILLDNFSVNDLHKAVEMIDGKCLVEASGGVNLSTIRQIAETGVDFISVGSLTQSCPQIDIGLDFIK